MSMPRIYRGAFFVFDIFLPIFGVFGYTMAADTMVLSSFTERPSWPPTPEMRMVLDGSAGWHAAFAFVQAAFLVRRPNDMFIWRTLNMGTLLNDFFMLLGLCRALSIEGRLHDTALWRGADWGNFIGYSAIALVRIAFLMGVGVPKEVGGKKLAAKKNAKRA